MESFATTETVTGGVLLKKMFLKISRHSQENICIRVFIKKDTPIQVFYCDFCEIFKNAIFTEYRLLLYHSIAICSILDVCRSHAYFLIRFAQTKITLFIFWNNWVIKENEYFLLVEPCSRVTCCVEIKLQYFFRKYIFICTIYTLLMQLILAILYDTC